MKIIEEKIAWILKEKFLSKYYPLTLSTDLKNDLGLDYLDLIDLRMTLETEFAIEIADQELDVVRTMKQLVFFIKNHRR